jgi:replication factor C small subunit
VVGQGAIVERLQSYVRTENVPNMLFAGPAGVGKTTCAHALSHELYGDAWSDNFTELNASDERGIDVVRDKIKNFARTSPVGDADYKLIFLDEADALTRDAQPALRRTMEMYTNTCRFILSCNYSSNIIDPIQSRCTVFRFSPVDEDSLVERLREIADEEGIEVTDEGYDALAYVSDGDVRRAVNSLQAAAALGETVDDEAVYETTSTARAEEVEELLEYAIAGNFAEARGILNRLLDVKGISGGDLIDQMHRAATEIEVDDSTQVHLMDRIGETDYRISTGGDERIQIEAFLAGLATDDAR